MTLLLLLFGEQFLSWRKSCVLMEQLSNSSVKYEKSSWSVASRCCFSLEWTEESACWMRRLKSRRQRCMLGIKSGILCETRWASDGSWRDGDEKYIERPWWVDFILDSLDDFDDVSGVYLWPPLCSSDCAKFQFDFLGIFLERHLNESLKPRCNFISPVLWEELSDSEEKMWYVIR